MGLQSYMSFAGLAVLWDCLWSQFCWGSWAHSAHQLTQALNPNELPWAIILMSIAESTVLLSFFWFLFWWTPISSQILWTFLSSQFWWSSRPGILLNFPLFPVLMRRQGLKILVSFTAVMLLLTPPHWTHTSLVLPRADYSNKHSWACFLWAFKRLPFSVCMTSHSSY